MLSRPALPGLSRESGASLIEVLVSILVIALGILSMAAVQSNAIRYQKTTEFRAMATMLAADLADRMRANETGAATDQYRIASDSYADGLLTEDNEGTQPSCGTLDADGALTPCSVNDISALDLFEWRRRVRMTLPNAAVHIAQFDTAQRAIEFWVGWTEADDKDASGNSRAPRATECPPTDVWAEGKDDPAFHCVYLRVAL
ncbi:MAG: type IV pilus modification protein PilV [Aquabacterium sp.]